MNRTTLIFGTSVVAFVSACSAGAGDDGVTSQPVMPCTATNTCLPASGGAGGFIASGGAVATTTGGVTATGGVAASGTGGLPPAAGGTLGAGSGGAPPGSGGGVGVPLDGCDYPIEFHARKDASGAKFPVPEGTIDLYECFAFKVDVPAGVQATRFVPMIDQSRVVHHYILYKMMVSQADGATSPCVGLHRDGIFLDGWAPGQSGVTLPDDVGMDIGTGDFMMEIHYNNFGASTEDATGIKVCGTRTPRPNKATVSFLGTEAVFIPPASKGVTASSNCTPAGQQGPITIVRSWPHMHLLGRHMKADILRANGAVESLFDKAFDFSSQMGYPTPAVINPGDSIKTTCTWDNPGTNTVTFGEGTQSEMCYNFTVAYPAQALVSFGLHTTSCNN
jgi:hypothetical protein